MGHILFVAAVVFICVGWWLAVYAAPRQLSLILPRSGLIFSFGFGFFALGLGGAALAVYGTGSPGAFVASLVTAFWGGWMMLAPTAALRTTPEDTEMMERLAVMLVALMCVLVLSFYAGPEAIAGLQFWLVLLGAFVATRGLIRSNR